MEQDMAVPEPPVSAPPGYMARTFRSLRSRNFRLFIGGQLVSTTGTWMQMVALPWLVLELTGSTLALGVATALGALPILLFAAWAGVIADRFDNRKVQIATQVAYAVLAFAMWALDASGVVTVEMIYVVSFLIGCVTAVDMPARQSFYLEMVGPEDLTNAMSLNTATFTGARITGPVLGAAVISTLGTAPAFLINGVSYLAVIVALLAMRESELHRRERVPRAKGQVREGIRYVWDTPELRLPIVLMAVVFVFSFNFQVLLPPLAKQTFEGDAGTFGAMLALFGVGSLVGALYLAGRSSRPNPRRLALLGVALGALSLVTALMPSLWLVYLLMPPLGFVGIGFPITGNSTLQLTASDRMRGRVMGLYTVIFLGSAPIGGPIAGWIGETFGPRTALAAGAVVAVAAGLAALGALTGTRPQAQPR